MTTGSLALELLKRLTDARFCPARCPAGHWCTVTGAEHDAHEFRCADLALATKSNRVVVDRDCVGDWGIHESWSEVAEVSRKDMVMERLRACLGLVPWDTYVAQRIQMNLALRNYDFARRTDEMSRGTGRTTRGIVGAVTQCLLSGSRYLVIMGGSRNARHCYDVARVVIDQLNLTIVLKTFNNQHNGRDAVFYYDHHYYQELP